jgi:putative transposase
VYDFAMPTPQPHRKKVKHYHVAGHFHELTFSCYRRKPLLTNDKWREMLSRSVDAACDTEEFQLIAFVFMPEHVHLLVLPDDAKSNVSRLLAKIKQPFSKQIKEVLQSHKSRLLNSLTVRERPGMHCFRFWQEGPGFDRNLHKPQAIEASIEYIHLNPVRRKLCKRAVDWKWSSARFHLQATVDAHLPKLSKLPEDFTIPGGIQIAQNA